jgi:succinate dehydrogenase / fumarate reductase flavoprotein subunit
MHIVPAGRSQYIYFTNQYRYHDQYQRSESMQTITADVVVVGGGAAGCYAALNLKKAGLNVVMVSKGMVGKSGAALFAGNLVLAGHMLGNSDQQARDTAEFLIKYHNQFLIDQTWAKRCGQWIEEVYYPELEEAGLYFRRDDAGEMVISPGRIRSIAANAQGNSGVAFMDLRRKQIMKAGIERYEETAVTALTTREDGSVGGVFGVHILTGECLFVRARAVVLATGYSDRLHLRSTGTREMAGDGIAMAWRAGASMVNLEMQWWHTNDVAHPPSWQRMQIYPNPILGSPDSAHMVNADGEEFFNQQKDDPLAYGPYTVQLKALVRQVHLNKASYEGGYYAGFDHMDVKAVDTYTTYGKVFKQLGMDGSNYLLETAVTAHYRQGGILVDNTTMRSTVEGLFIAGGVGGHSNGLIALATYDGKVVADGVTAAFASLPVEPVHEAIALREYERVTALLTDRKPDPITPAALKKAIQECMTRDAGVEKSEAGLQHALAQLERLRREALPRMQVGCATRVANYEWFDAMDVVNMIDAAELIVRASLQRQESRGPFMRSDYPDTDNIHWLAANVMHKRGGDVEFERIPYATPTFSPGFDTKPNMEVAW